MTQTPGKLDVKFLANRFEQQKLTIHAPPLSPKLPPAVKPKPKPPDKPKPPLPHKAAPGDYKPADNKQGGASKLQLGGTFKNELENRLMFASSPLSPPPVTKGHRPPIPIFEKQHQQQPISSSNNRTEPPQQQLPPLQLPPQLPQQLPQQLPPQLPARNQNIGGNVGNDNTSNQQRQRCVSPTRSNKPLPPPPPPAEVEEIQKRVLPPPPVQPSLEVERLHGNPAPPGGRPCNPASRSPAPIITYRGQVLPQTMTYQGRTYLLTPLPAPVIGERPPPCPSRRNGVVMIVPNPEYLIHGNDNDFIPDVSAEEEAEYDAQQRALRAHTMQEPVFIPSPPPLPPARPGEDYVDIYDDIDLDQEPLYETMPA